MKTYYPFVSRRKHRTALTLSVDTPVSVERGEMSVQLIITNTGASTFVIAYEATATFAQGRPVAAGATLIEDYDGPVWLIRTAATATTVNIIEGF